MKRLSPVEQYGSKLQRKSDTYAEALAQQKFELRFLLPSECAGAIIGRKGDKIKALREQYDATLKVSSDPTAERVFTIVVDQEKLADCFKDVVVANLSGYKEMKNAEQEFELRMLIHESLAGAIIGRKGANIKELRKQTRAKLKIFTTCAPESSERVFMVSAPQERLPDVVKQIVDVIKEMPIKGNTVLYDPSNSRPDLVSDYGGCPTANSGDHLTYGAAGGDMRGNNVTYGGTAQSFQMAGQNQYDFKVMQVTVPNDLVEVIKGENNENIDYIRQVSGAQVDIGNAYANNERIISVTGTSSQVREALFNLQECMRSSEAGRRYLGH